MTCPSKTSPGDEQIIGKLREAEVLLGQGSTVGEVSRKLSVTEQTYYRWRREYGGIRVEQARRLKGAGEGEREAQETGGIPDASINWYIVL